MSDRDWSVGEVVVKDYYSCLGMERDNSELRG